MIIDQSLFLHFMDSPKLAWFKVNQPDTYDKIMENFNQSYYDNELKYKIAALLSDSVIDISQVL